MKFNIALGLLAAVCLSIGCQGDSATGKTASKENQVSKSEPKTDVESDPKSRSFEFSYGATLKDVPSNAEVKVWFPIAQTSAFQTVKLREKTIPGDLQVNSDPVYGNQIGYFAATQSDSPISFRMNYDVVRMEGGIDQTEPTLTEETKKKYLSANTLVPLDGKPLDLIANVELSDKTMEAAQALYQVVEEHMKYDKSQPGYGNGDVLWACDSKTGNCTDFHSLFISLARGKEIPARFEIGFPLPTDKEAGKIGGYHCWAWYHADGTGWSPVDISEADKHPEMKEYYFGKLTQDRVAFSMGRDIELVPANTSGKLNYFVYPHVEVDGKVWPKDKIELDFSFKNSD